MLRQSTNQLLMIRPAVFRRNEQTAGDNKFQPPTDLPSDAATKDAVSEFDQFYETLVTKGVEVIVIPADHTADTPDALFPNNWLSFHADGYAALYPMKAENRRKERREEIINIVCNEFGLEITEIVDFTEFESHDKFLEGTGSLVLDRVNNKAYASLSERTDRQAVERFCEALGYEGILFNASHQSGNDSLAPIYHTNVVMSIGTSFALLCADAIKDAEERNLVRENLTENGRELIEIDERQMADFAANVLEVLNNEGNRYLVMSARARNALTIDQKKRIEKHVELLSAPLTTIENLGGGSARCMLCEVFLPKL